MSSCFYSTCSLSFFLSLFFANSLALILPLQKCENLRKNCNKKMQKKLQFKCFLIDFFFFFRFPLNFLFHIFCVFFVAFVFFAYSNSSMSILFFATNQTNTITVTTPTQQYKKHISTLFCFRFCLAFIHTSPLSFSSFFPFQVIVSYPLFLNAGFLLFSCYLTWLHISSLSSMQSYI